MEIYLIWCRDCCVLLEILDFWVGCNDRIEFGVIFYGKEMSVFFDSNKVEKGFFMNWIVISFG